MIYIKVSLKPHWGFLINYSGFTKSRPALRVIPPTTLIGALAYGLFRNQGETSGEYSKAEVIRPIFRGVHLRVNVPLIEYSDLSRVFSYKVRDKRIITDAVAVGKLYTIPLSNIEVVYLIDENKADEIIGNNWHEKLISASWSICRIGARESIVSAEEVTLSEAEVIRDRVVKTSFYFPFRAAKDGEVKGTYVIYNVVDWTEAPIGDYTTSPRIPLVFPYDMERFKSVEVEVRLNDRVNAVRVGKDIVIPWR
ncbi:MAG: type I-A CRISPR-associated protein Cas5 [Thermoprotei archaeon]|nr:MAG: type I-A CRISPR-associated protein Cas5 [Thermoprotei archaeon]